ncbi:MAG TPA: alcohol dehydrogenase catalytic domain-containing protein [Thermodesulfobacteriota bacterium]|nr:alcohol dehydrogenase catalytic domain-containing protein [Thermodesulfobacteriota bacterium]
MKRMTRSMVVEKPGFIGMKEFPVPEIGPEDGLLRIEMAGVCVSDPGLFHGKAFSLPIVYPLILGHEIVGRIEEIGEEAGRRRNLKKGDRVIVETAFGCGFCRACLTGSYVQCESSLMYGHTISCDKPPHLWGAYGEYLYLAPRAMVHKISDDLPAEAAVLIGAVLGNAVRWLRMFGNVSIGHTVVIEGPGLQGLAAVIVARESGASRIIVTGLRKDASRFALAREFGATDCIFADEHDPVEAVREITGGRMAHIVMDVTGTPKGAVTALDLVGRRGTIILPGIYGAEKAIPLALDKVVFKEVRVQGVLSQSMDSVVPAVALAELRKYPIEKMVTHRFALSEAEKALKIVGREIEDEGAIKVVLVP